MFSTKGLFAAIPCPNQNECLLPTCIFGHDIKTPASLGLGSSPDVAQHVEDDAPRKRRKIEGESLGTTSSEAPSPLLKEDLASVNHERDANIVVSSLKRSPSKQDTPLNNRDSRAVNGGSVLSRPISPPIRKKPAPSKHQVTREPAISRPSSVAIESAVASNKNTPVIKSTARPTKAEALNPRMIKQAPASHEMRTKLLKALHDQLVRLNTELAKDANDAEEELILTNQQLIIVALDLEELATASPKIYGNVIRNKIMLYKRMDVSTWKDEMTRRRTKVKALDASSASKPTRPTDEPIVSGLTIAEEVALLPKLYTSVADLERFNYISSAPTAAEILKAQAGVEAAKGYEICDRCRTRFQVFPGRREEDGLLATGGRCTYHHGKPMLQDKSSAERGEKREKRFRCCGEAIGDSTGCVHAEHHVFKISDAKRLASILQFDSVSLVDYHNKSSKKPPVCIDGEMGYTVYGLELIRLTATSWPDNTPLLDVLVRPEGEILDLNSRFSGVWPEDMANAIPYDPNNAAVSIMPSSGESIRLPIVASIATARRLLFEHLTPDTPIIGHGLENDLNATRIIHLTLIDTALLYPHRAGLPYRNALRILVKDLLGRDIQNTTEVKTSTKSDQIHSIKGHDSREDAIAAGDLVRLRLVKTWQAMKRAGWRCEGGVFHGPKGERTVRFERVDRPGLQQGTGLQAGDDGTAKKRNFDRVEEEGEGELAG